MIRVLFVDEDPLILKGLQQWARASQAEQWEVHVASPGANALDELARHPIDVIVTEVRAGRNDRAELLRQIHQRHPHANCLVLGNGVGEHSGLRLTNPGDFPALVPIVERSYGLARRLNDAKVRGAIASIGKLPVLPRLYLDLVRELENPQSDSASVGRIIEQDVAMTARILQMANSAFFAPGRKLRFVREAIAFMGVLAVRTVVLTAQLFQSASEVKTPGFSLQALQAHSLLTAMIASRLVDDPEERQVAFAAGMLHDIGKMVMATGMPARYAQLQVRSLTHRASELSSEHAVFGCTHAEIGACLLSSWGLPDTLVEAVAFHHAPVELTPARFGAVGAVHVANALAHEGEFAMPADVEHESLLDSTYLRKVGIDENIASWQAKLALAS